MDDKYLNLIKQHRWPVLSVVSGLLFIIIFFSRVVPSIGEILEVHRQIQECREKIAGVDTGNLEHQRIEQDKLALKGKIEQFVFDQNQDSQMPQLLAFLMECAKEKDVCILKIQPEPSRRKRRHVEVPIQLILTTKFHQLGAFINAIETSKPIIRVESVSMSSKTMTSIMLDVKMTLVVYYLGQSG